MWLPALSAAIAAGDVDVAVSCGDPQPAATAVRGRDLWGEPLLVGVRPGHRLAGRERIALVELEQEVLGRARESLFPAWARAQDQALAHARTNPRSVELEDTDLGAGRWVDQSEVDWVLLTPSLAGPHHETVFRPVEPHQVVPFTLQWRSGEPRHAAIGRSIDVLMQAGPPPGWDGLPVREDGRRWG